MRDQMPMFLLLAAMAILGLGLAILAFGPWP
jgi:hypothetical protein